MTSVSENFSHFKSADALAYILAALTCWHQSSSYQTST